MTWRRAAWAVGLAVAVALALFLVNGLSRAWETPEVARTQHAHAPSSSALRR